MITTEQLRKQFELMAYEQIRDIDRRESGEYISASTFQMWAGYWQCAKLNGVIDKDTPFEEWYGSTH